ncbi:CotH kinase family protein [Lachnospiraceae bacterium C1.1]|nr:CotH kinase family protein [Lachnospiraceae bacterium C1.1]
MKKQIRKYWQYLLLAAVIIVIMLYLADAMKKDTTIVINEVCSSNFSTISNNFGEYPDWIELYNTTDKDIDLTGYRISKGAKLSAGWKLPEMSIKAHGYLLIFADKDSKDDPMTADFNLSSDGENLFLTSAGGAVIDEEEIPKLEYDTSWGRVSDGAEEWSRMTATPGADNSSSEILADITDESVEFSRDSGFYDDGFELELSGTDGGSIYYTLDGTEPDMSSYKYTDPIEIEDISDSPNIYSARTDPAPYFEKHYSVPEKNVDKAVIIRAAAFKDDGSKGKTVTKTYFIGFDEKEAYENIAMVSLVTDPDNLFSYSDGIYVTGKTYDDYIISENKDEYDKSGIWWWTPGNYHQRGRESERETSVSFFDEEHKLLFTENIGLRIKGGGSRGFAQKGFNLFPRNIYGNAYLEKTLFEGYENERSLSLFAGGDDNKTKIKDVLIARLLKNLDVSVLDGRLSAVFLDGEYWGAYWIYERFNADYFAEKYGVDPDNVIMIKNDELAIGNEGDKKYYDEMNSFTFHNDLSDDEAYEKFSSYLDMDSVLDYYAAQIYIAHTDDWPGSNVGLWRVRETGDGKYEDGKWRFCVFDVNSSSMDLENVDMESLSYAAEKNYLLRALMQNKSFRKLFAERFEKISKKVFGYENVLEYINSISSELRPQIEKTYERYYAGRLEISDFDKDVEELREFYQRRYDGIIGDVLKNCKD